MRNLAAALLTICSLSSWSSTLQAVIPQDRPASLAGGVRERSSQSPRDAYVLDYQLKDLGSTLWSPADAAAIFGDHYLHGTQRGITIVRPPQKMETAPIAQMETNGGVQDIVIYGHFAAVGAFYGIHVFDLSTIRNPVQTGRYNTYCDALCMHDSLIFSGNYQGISVFSVDSAGGLTLRSSWQTARVHDLEVCDSVLIASTDDGLMILRATISELPQLLCPTLVQYGADHVVVGGSMAYVGPLHQGVDAIDLSNPANPSVIQSIPTSIDIAGFGVCDSLMVVALNDRRIQVWDLNGSPPAVIGVVNTQWDLSDVKVFPRLAMAMSARGVWLVPLADPTKPHLTLRMGSPGFRGGVYARDTLAYEVDDYDGGLHIVNIRNQEKPEEIGYVDMPDRCVRACVKDGFCYVASYTAGLVVVDVSNPEKPEVVSGFPDLGGACDVTVEGDFAYMPMTRYLAVFDVSDPLSPKLAGYFNDSTECYGVVARDTIAYLSSGLDGLTILNIANPLQPVFVSRLDLPDEASELRIQGDYVYVGCPDVSGYGGTVCIVNVSNITNPWLVSQIEDVPAYCMSVNGRYACYGSPSDYWRFADISDPSNPFPITPIFDGGMCGAWPSDTAFAVALPLSLELMAVDNYNCDIGQGNHPPVILSSTSDSTRRGMRFTYMLEANDPDCDGRGLSYSFENLPSGFHVDSTTASGIVGCTATDFSFGAIVTDDVLADTEVVSVKVGEALMPRLIPPEDTALRSGQYFRYTLRSNVIVDSLRNYLWFEYPQWCQAHGDTIEGIAPGGWSNDLVSVLLVSRCQTVIQGFRLVSYMCGDADSSNEVSIADAVYLVQYIFNDGNPPAPWERGDADCDGVVLITDVVYLVNYIFNYGAAPCAACP